jgi:hypothetical protein
VYSPLVAVVSVDGYFPVEWVQVDEVLGLEASAAGVVA